MKNIFISGVSRGIGYATMKRFIQAGYLVYGTYNSGEKEAEEIQKRFKKKVRLFKVNFENEDEIVKLVKKLQHIKLQAIINNAGMFELEDFNNYDFGIWDRTMQVNLKSVLIISLGLSNNLLQNGSIVNIASTDGNMGSFAGIAYSASKAGMINITKSLANNFGERRIRVNAINPGWINTGMSTQSSYLATEITPLSRNGKPEEIAQIAYFLVSKKASFISGSVITADGGYTNVDTIMKKESLEKE